MLEPIKKSACNTFNKLLHHHHTQNALFLAINKVKPSIPAINNDAAPYYQYQLSEPISMRDDIVFVTGRFRSGSTVLWNVFRSQADCTAYYEPFNERRWFDGNTRGAGVDGTHIGVDNYWREYENLSALDQFYNEDWIRDQLMMDASCWNPNMVKFIETMVASAKGRPVLQFNRIDFRLAWFKHYFPNAKILHLYRHPRDQWCSFLTDKRLMNKDDVVQSYQDNFYLESWCQDLSKHFPFLTKAMTPHPYQRFYYLWKLSYLFGQHYADHSICYEKLCTSPKEQLTETFNVLNWQQPDIDAAASVLAPPILDKWKKYAPEDWFVPFEQECEQNLSLFLSQLKV